MLLLLPDTARTPAILAPTFVTVDTSVGAMRVKRVAAAPGAAASYFATSDVTFPSLAVGRWHGARCSAVRPEAEEKT
jgi:hypothetical protein